MGGNVSGRLRVIRTVLSVQKVRPDSRAHFSAIPSAICIEWLIVVGRA